MTAKRPSSARRVPVTPPDIDPIPLTEAVSAAARGCYVFPVHSAPGGICTCKLGNKCGEPAKHPRIKDNFEEATSDPARIRAWAGKWPGTNWGLACGKSGLVALDIDPRHGGVESLKAHTRKHGKLPGTPLANTGGNGTHAIFRHPGDGWKIKSVNGALGDGLDVKGDGGFIVLAGSVHASGERYGWSASAHPAAVRPAELPRWIRDKVGVRLDVTEQTEHTESNLSVNSVPSVTSSPVPTVSFSPPPPPDAGASNAVSNASSIAKVATVTGLTDEEERQARIDAAINAHLPTSAGQRNRRIFSFARALKSFPELADAPPRDLRGIVQMWHRAALSTIETKDFDSTWIDFVEAWGRVKFPEGTGPLAEVLARVANEPDPPECAPYDSDRMRNLIKLCLYLQGHAGVGPFYLSCETAGKLFKESKMHAWRRLKTLVVDGLLTIAELHTPVRATRYRFNRS